MTAILAPDTQGVAEAAALIRGGGLVAFGTETVYGLGADAGSTAAIARLYAAKGRPAHNPLISHFADAESAFAEVDANPAARALAAAFWPGPLTLVLPVRDGGGICAAARAGLPSAAVRVPRGDVLAGLLRACGRPVAAPSANRSGHVSPTQAAHVLADLHGRIDAVLDTGPCAVGVESTVLDLCGRPRLLRPGGISLAAISEVIGPIEGGLSEGASDTDAPGDGVLRAPGMMASHYAPSLPLRLGARDVAAEEALLGFGPDAPAAALALNLSPAGDLDEAAHNLFAYLRAIDERALAAGKSCIAVWPIPHTGIGLAINDRLRRAAAPRPGGR